MLQIKHLIHIISIVATLLVLFFLVIFAARVGNTPAKIISAFGSGCVVSLFLFLLNKGKHQTYEMKAHNLFMEIRDQVETIKSIMKSIATHEKKKRKKLDRDFQSRMTCLCDDAIILLDKLTEKNPDSRMTDGKMIRGLLDYLLVDILPQYNEMMTCPRFYIAPKEKMSDGKEAIKVLGGFIHNWITELELGDEIRYEIAVSMIMALKARKPSTSTALTANQIVSKHKTGEN